MAPSVAEHIVQPNLEPHSEGEKNSLSNGDSQSVAGYVFEPLKLSYILDQFNSFDVTPGLGTEFPDANIVEWMRAPNSDVLIRDLAILISQRGVVFFRAQNDMDNEIQKELIDRLGRLTHRPRDGGLHIHPVLNPTVGLGHTDPAVSAVNYEHFKKMYDFIIKSRGGYKKQDARDEWHNDVAYEPFPADYSSLRMVVLPKTGGDTLWASGYELYDRISKPVQKFLETLTATCAQPAFNASSADKGFAIYDKPRGNPANIGTQLQAVHPVIRTNPVTGWKSLFPIGYNVIGINDVHPDESRGLLDWFSTLLAGNHELQLRHRWINKNDLAIWDNRSALHAATVDYDEPRVGERVVGCGEKPYLDPISTGRREALEK